MNSERAQLEIQYRLSKWMVIELLKEQILTEAEAEMILQNLLEKIDPPTRGLEVIDFGKKNHED